MGLSAYVGGIFLSVTSDSEAYITFLFNNGWHAVRESDKMTNNSQQQQTTCSNSNDNNKNNNIRNNTSNANLLQFKMNEIKNKYR